MMLTPVQQTPLPLDPVRQQVTPQTPISVPSPPQPAPQPVLAAGTPDQSNSGPDSEAQQQAKQQQQQAETADKLRAAWIRLTELQQQAAQALASGDAKQAKAAAEEAAAVAQTIKDTSTTLPDTNVSGIELAAQQLSQNSPSGGQGGGGASATVSAPASDGDSSGGYDVGSALDVARAGLGTAIDVVDTAASIPYQPAADQTAISGYRQQILEALSGVEAVASRISSTAKTGGRTSAGTTHLDISA